ncbi:MAG: substrate-binding domain-containing protein [Candidatus Thorarchaeota archaeon]
MDKVTAMKKEMKILATTFIVITLVISFGIVLYLNQTQEKETLVISTTTSLFDTGVLDVLKESYEAENPDTLLAFISAGTGIAITHAKNGDADLILVHSPSQEWTFMNETYGVNRKIFAYNFFTIVGPATDPAGISTLDPIEALQAIYSYGHATNTSLWVSRDDRSGTNSKEIALWEDAGYNYSTIKSEGWLLSSGSGMGTTLQLADELQLYTLSDIGTFLKYNTDGLIELDNLVGAGESLLNVYSAIAVNDAKVAGVHFNLAMEFIQWLVGDTAQSIIRDFGESEYGQSLFNPSVEIIETQVPAQIYDWIRANAFFEFEGTLYECPPIWRTGQFSLYPMAALSSSSK